MAGLRKTLALCCACLAVGPAAAQEADKDYLTAFLEDTLSDAGRQVTVTGFTGALSSRAAIERLTIADDQGIWITLEDVVLDWSRSSLLSGALEVDELSAGSIRLDRLPQASDGLPAAESSGFSLPELPVTIDITRIAADRIELGPKVAGQPVTGSLAASMSLAGGEGKVQLDLFRTDATEGRITLASAYSNATRIFDLRLQAQEAAGGLVVSALGLPGKPSVALDLAGSGPLEAFAAELRLATAGEDRLTGVFAILAPGADGHRLVAQVKGNIAPLLAPEYADFFGTEVSLDLDARRSSGGRITVDRFDLAARSLSVAGRAELAADGLPEFLDLTGRLAAPDGAPMLLPLSGEPTRVQSADFALRTTRGPEDSWTARLAVDGLDRADLKVRSLALEGSGRIGRSTAGRSFGGTFTLAASGIQPSDPALAQAIGPDLRGGFRLHMLEGGGELNISGLSLTAPGYQAEGAVRIAGLERDFLATGRLAVTAEDFARFSGLAGRPLRGAGRLQLSGSASRLTGAFDADLAFTGTGLATGLAELDRLLAGETALSASVRRDETGTALRSFALDAGPLAARASGRISSDGATLGGRIDLADLGALGPQYGGRLGLAATFDGAFDDARITLDGTARSLRSGSAELDKLLAGDSQLALRLALVDGVLRIDEGRFDSPQLRVLTSGSIAGTERRLTLDARLANLALLAPGFQGPLTLTGTALQDARGTYTLDLAGRGPGQVDARVTGQVAGDFRSADLAIRGTGRAELANLFIAPRAASGALGYDLVLRGAFALRALSGRITLSEGRVTDPGLGLSLNDLAAIATLQDGALRLSATSGLSSGGRIRIDGPVGLTAPYPADLAITLDALRLYDPELYEARVSGALSLTGGLRAGPLLSGRLQLAEAEVRVPASGFSSAAALLDIRHRNEPQAVQATRRHAGLLQTGAGGAAQGDAARPVALDLTIAAPNQLFVRGRGIDAELGGALRLTGTTANVIPSGGFTLIRGRLDILGKRLVLSRADLSLEGRLVPEIVVQASAASDGVQSFVTIEGPADDPAVSFTSSPELPQEEVLARLLFGRDLTNISAFQAAQLANAVATLAGRGGEGLIGNLRRSTGLDDLDITTAEDGGTTLKAGKYISENAYTEIELDQDGKSQINLNLDLREGVTVKGRLGADGETGIGIFIENDY